VICAHPAEHVPVLAIFLSPGHHALTVTDLALEGPDDAITAALLAPTIEVSAHPKPGNVSPVASFPDIAHAHFLASAAALHGPLHALASRATGEPSAAGLGRAMEEAVLNGTRWHHGGNTLLGTIFLIFPLAAGAVRTLAHDDRTLDGLISAARELVREATSEDTGAIYRAIAAASPGGLGRTERWDATAPDAADQVVSQGVTPLVAFGEAVSRDDVARELVEGFPRSRRCCSYLLDRDKLESEAVVLAYMDLLAERPDSLIRRKAGDEVAREVMNAARSIVTGLEPLSVDWWHGIRSLDDELRKDGNRRNPGTTADITAAGLFLALCCGLRP